MAYDSACPGLPPGIHDYDQIVRDNSAGRYSFASVITAAGRRLPLIGVSEAHLNLILDVGNQYQVGLILSGSRVVGPRTKQGTLHPLLAKMTPLESNGRLASDNYPEVRDITISKNAIKELGRDSPHTSDLSIVLIDTLGRPHAHLASIAAEIANTCLSMNFPFPVRVFSSLAGLSFSSVADYVGFHREHLFRRDLPQGFQCSDEEFATAAYELFAYFPYVERNSRWTDRNELTTNEYATGRKFEIRRNVYAHVSTNPTPWYRWLFKMMPPIPNRSTIIDLGSGPGHLWAENIEDIKDGWKIILGDLSHGILLESLRVVPPSTSRIGGRCVLDAVALPFNDSACDVIIADSVLYHVKEAASALRECCRVLRPGGLFHAATLGTQHLDELVKLLRVFDQNPALDLMPGGFLLDHAVEILDPFFTHIELHRYPDKLIFPDVKVLMTYLLATNICRHFQYRLDKLEAFLAPYFANGKTLTVHTDVGLVLAKRGIK